MSGVDPTAKRRRSRAQAAPEAPRTLAPPPAAAVAPNPRPHASLLRPKGNLSPLALRLLLLVAAVPLLMMVFRVLALPGAAGSGLDGPIIGAIRTLGSTLNQSVSLMSVPPDERDRVLYLLFVPTCALLVTLARLTFGIRVLGFRSILIAVGFHECGILPSLFLITVVVVTIVLVRPWLRKVRLPLYARVSVILCIVAMTMVAAVLAGPWMRSEILWGVVYFPIIVLGMLAEGIAKTLDHDNMATASWRAITTIALAFLLSLLGQVPALRGFLLQFPEIVLTEVVAVVMIAEYLDLRLFQDWDARIAGMAVPGLASMRGGLRVAVVRDRIDAADAARGGRPLPPPRVRRTVHAVTDALRANGHTVSVFDGDGSLLKQLRRFMPADPRSGAPSGVVFNLAHGTPGESDCTHVPAVLDLAGIAYTGPSPLGYAMALDRVIVKTLLQQAGVLSPPLCLMANHKQRTTGLHYPLIVKPRHAARYRLLVAEDRQRLGEIVRRAMRRYRQDVVVEEYILGRRISVALLGNDPVECLPIVEHRTDDRVCPAPIDSALAARIRDAAIAAFKACGCRDYARVDMRIADLGNPYVVDVSTIGVLDRGGSFAYAAAQAGWSFDELVGSILDAARARSAVREPIPPVQFPPETATPGADSASTSASA